MATGSGKTLIMAGLMLYLYKQGYRNFLFFVNLTNILDKTRENFLNPNSAKYLFVNDINIDGETIRVNVVENFQASDENAINICFETTQGLHTKIFAPRENDMTFNDFEDKKVVLISDESHHLNAETKSVGKKADMNTWEQTVKTIFNNNYENILLEFTATCDIGNLAIRAAYEDKIIFDYPLQKFYNDKYSKDIVTLRSDFSVMDKVLQAVVLSQYRLKIFQANRLSIKPVILFKSAKIDDSQKFMAEFLDVIKKLNGERLDKLSKICKNEMMIQALEYFSRNKITLEMLASELRDDFSEQHCISVNNDNDAETKQLLLNSLEDKNNPYRAIFEVKKLDEGWDVLNLFDIVRLYETRQSGGKKISSSTISEAQLIGRGARYCPFKIDDEQSKFQRKFDSDATNELRICETLYYHCQNDSRYINELKMALREIGLDTDKIFKRQYILKDIFKNDDLYKEGIIFLNSRQEKESPVMYEIPASIRDVIYNFQISRGLSGLSQMMTNDVDADNNRIEIYTVRRTIKEIAAINFSLVNKALRQYPIYQFNNLKLLFPNLFSTKNFIIDEKFLGNVQINIKSCKENLSVEDLYSAVCYVLKKISDNLSNPKKEYEGTKNFNAYNIRDIFQDKTVNFSVIHDDRLGVSQNDSSLPADLKIDLSLEDWFAHTDNYGTSEEKALVAYFRDHINELRKYYNKIFLIRNERQLHIYSFDSGERFEPDYVLLLQKNNSSHIEQWQIFIESKGTHLLHKDTWKENFLLQLQKNAVPIKKFADDNNYEIWGFHFFNQAEGFRKFDDDFMSLINR